MKGYQKIKSLVVVTASTAAIVPTSELKTHLRVTTSDDDSYIADLGLAAKEVAEEYCNRYFLATTVETYLDEWYSQVDLYKSPLKSITHVKYYDTNNTLQTLAASNYNVDISSMPGRLDLSNATFPSLYGYRTGQVVIRYVVGESSASDIDNVKLLSHAIKLLVGHWYENRQDVITGTQVNMVPETSRFILDKFKIDVL